MPKTPQLSDVLTGAAMDKAPHEQELERKAELLKKVRSIRDATFANRGAVRGEADKAYLWVNIREERQIYFRGLGWERVDSSDTIVATAYRQPDGTHVRGDLILYKMDRDLAEAFQLDNVLKGLHAVDAPKQRFRTEAQREGVPTFTPKIA